MNANQFLNIVSQGDQLSKDQVNQLFKLHQNFPYFQIPNILLAKYELQKSKGSPSDFLAFAAINSPNRAWLKILIEDPDAISNLTFLSSKPKATDAPEKLGNAAVLEDESESELVPRPLPETDPSKRVEILKKLDEDLKSKASLKPAEEKEVVKPRKKRSGPDDLIETIRKKEKKEILDVKKKEQIDIIKSFSKKDIKLATLKEIENFQKQSDLSENSTKLNPDLLSESYAKLLAKQGKNKKAKEIYQKLMVKFPNKSTYFADLIKELENKN
ncbi:hypothetical protein MM236_00100 [Belliella sp. DSM 107340]|uniref:Tetratricopeptide repeat-containing protein n=1 Tax=Belliella calami TaxID=2923436 RepID=A0ABS9UIC8_9BACT|nr:hypothetical protein [Belliella calami]MCH7396361.1 hypothetical protein [Belliella calami]